MSILSVLDRKKCAGFMSASSEHLFVLIDQPIGKRIPHNRDPSVGMDPGEAFDDSRDSVERMMASAT